MIHFAWIGLSLCSRRKVDRERLSNKGYCLHSLSAFKNLHWLKLQVKEK